MCIRDRRLIRDAEISYWREQFAETENSKSFWRILRKDHGKKEKKPIPPVQDSDWNILTNDYNKAQEMKNYFANIGTKRAEKSHHDSGASLNHPLASVNPGTAVLDQVEQIKLKLTHIKQKTMERYRRQKYK